MKKQTGMAADAHAMETMTAATPGTVDVVVLVAVSSSSSPAAAKKISDGVMKIAKSLVTDIGEGFRLSLVAKGAPTILKAASSMLASVNAKAVDYDLKPSLALVGGLAAGCEATASMFPAKVTAAMAPMLCGESLLSVEGSKIDELQNAALPSLEPVRESLHEFLRPNAVRAYIVMSDGDAQYMNGEVLATVVKSQNGGRAAPVFALVPTADGANGDCASDSKAADTYKDVTGDTKGTIASFCDKDWSSSLKAITDSIVKLR